MATEGQSLDIQVAPFLADVTHAHRSPQTRRAYAGDGAQMCAFHRGPMLTTTAVVLRKCFGTHAHLRPVTRTRQQAEVGRFLTWAEQQKRLPANPMSEFDRVKLDPSQPHGAVRDQLERMFKAIAASQLRDRRFFRLLAETGLRVSEGLCLQVEHLALSLDHEHLTVVGKGGKRRTILLDDPRLEQHLWAFLKGMGDTHGPLLRAEKNGCGGRLRNPSRDYFCFQEGVTCTLHQCRHLHATESVKGGISFPICAGGRGRRTCKPHYALQSNLIQPLMQKCKHGDASNCTALYRRRRRNVSMSTQHEQVPGVRLAELLAALSLAIDLGLGQPMENFLRTCLLAVRLGKVLGVSEQDLVDIYYLGLIEHLGCTAYADETAAIFGDELEASSWLITTDQGHPTEMLGAMFQHIGKGEPALRRAQRITHALLTGPKKTEEVFRGRCEVAQCLAERMGLGTRLRDALGQVYERWDGKGLPHHFRGEAILLPVRVVRIAQDGEIFSRLRGKDGALSVLQKRAGGMYDPAIVDCCCRQADQVFQDPGESSMWEAVLAAEPGSRSCISEARLDEVLRAVADFVDLKSPYTLGHSSGVAELSAEAAQRCGLPEVDVRTMRRAGLLHDLGRIGVPNTIWDKPGPLTETEWERVRLHPYYTERVLARLKAIGSAGSIAAQHHERLDGSGYHRGLPASLLPMTARILAAADVYHALISPRPHRAAHSVEGAADELRRQVRAGLLDDEAVNAVLLVAGHRLRSTRRTWVAGLSDREVEVLRLVARGSSNSQVAAMLSLSTSTIHHHIQHIYNKLGVSTRAAAALFAMQHNLLS